MSLIVRPLVERNYAQCHADMKAFTQARGPDTADELWLCEHEPVFTLGLAGRREHLLAPGDIAVVQTERGGQVTYHGPGQVLAYPLLDLRRLGIGVKELVYRIEQAVIQVLDRYQLAGCRLPGAPGVYVPQSGGEGRFAGLAKIAALGVRVSRGCSLHGVALNVDMDLEPFSRINPCGYQGLRTIDMRRAGVVASPHRIAQELGERLTAHLQPSARARLAPGAGVLGSQPPVG